VKAVLFTAVYIIDDLLFTAVYIRDDHHDDLNLWL